MSYTAPSANTLSPVLITPWHGDSIGAPMNSALGNVGTPASAAWQTANRALFFPFVLRGPIQVLKLFWANGATAAGNVDCAIYDNAGNRLITAAPTAQTGTNVVQEVNTTDTFLGRGNYYMALVNSGTTGTFMMATSGSVGFGKLLGLAQQASAGTLPNPATMVAITVNWCVPIFGLACRTLVA